MAAIPPPSVVAAAASPGACGDVPIRVPAASAAAGGEVLPPRDVEGGDAGADANPEKQLSRFVRCVAFGEWGGNALGALAFLWATGVLLGGFCSSLNRQDFWFATVMIFIESFRIFSHRYKLDGQSLFGTTRALRWTNSSFLRMLGRPQEGNEGVLVLCLWMNLINILSFDIIRTIEIGVILRAILGMAVFVTWSWRLRRPKQWHIRALAIAHLVSIAADIVRGLLRRLKSPLQPPAIIIVEDIIMFVTVLMPILRPKRIADLTSTPCGRKLISLAKLTSAICLASGGLFIMFVFVDPSTRFYNTIIFILAFVEPFAQLLLSLGSLQKHEGSLFGRCTDAIMHISLIFYSVELFPMIELMMAMPDLSILSWAGLSLVLLVVLLLSGNLQIPAAVAQIMLSSLRLIDLLVTHIDYNPLPSGSSDNMVAAIAVFYVLALCQGSLYIMASFLGLLSAFPRRWLMQGSKLGGKLGAKAIAQYYDRAYAKQMEMGLFGAARSTMAFADFAIESLNTSNSSRDVQVAGLCVLHNMLQEQRRDDCSTQRLVLRVTSSSTAVSTLVGMLAWTDVEVEDEHGYLIIIRLLAARVTAELAGSLRISSTPGKLKLVASLLKLAENADAVVQVPNQQGEPGRQQTPLAIGNGGRWRCWVISRFWQRMKQDYWSVPEEPALLTHKDSSLPVLGMQILEKLARDLDNCAEIFKDDTANLISNTIGIIGLPTSAKEQNDALVCSSLEFLRRLATTGEKIGAELRQELWNHPFLLTCLTRVLEDDRNGSTHQVWEPAMDIIAKLALDKEAGLEIGRNQVITARLLHAFLGRHGATNMYYDQSLRKVSGEALANLALWGIVNCSAILEEPGYQVINDLTNMLSVDDQNRHVAASLLLNLCEHCSVNLLLSYPHASEHLSSALTTVMKHIMEAEGKQLESLISLASGIGDVMREAFARELESQTNSGAELVQKLVCTLNSKKIPNPEYPRMRRVIVKIVISILESCGEADGTSDGGTVNEVTNQDTEVSIQSGRVQSVLRQHRSGSRGRRTDVKPRGQSERATSSAYNLNWQ